MGWNHKLRRLWGVRRLTLAGPGSRFLLRSLHHRGISVWDVREKDGALSLTVAEAEAEDLLKAAKNLNLSAREGERFSWKTVVKSLWGRRFYLLGMAVFIAALVFVSGRVWLVEFRGVVPGDEERVLSLAEEYGTQPGKRLQDMGVADLLVALQKSTGPYSFAGAEIEGSRLTFTLREGTEPPQMPRDSDRPAHLLAAVSGTVEELIVLRGEAAVQKGDRVERGDVLVRGVLTALSDGRFIDFTNAAAIVEIGETLETEGEVLLNEVQTVPTGNFKRKINVEIRDSTFCLQYGKIVYNTYIEESQILKLPAALEKLGFGLSVSTLSEVEKVPVRRSEEQAVLNLAQTLVGPDARLRRVEVLWREANGDRCRYGLRLTATRQDTEQYFLSEEEMAAFRSRGRK